MRPSGAARRQFRVLHREFLFRVVDPELLSAHAAGGSGRLMVQVVSLLIFLSLLLSLPAWSYGEGRLPQERLLSAWSLEHFLVATTMLVAGLLVVLSWDALFPDRRDVLILAPLPIHTRTIFLSKAAALATALVLAVGSLHLVSGVVWPLMFGQSAPAFTMPALTSDPAMPPVGLDRLKGVLDDDLARALHGESALTAGRGGGLVIGVSVRGERRIFTYGEAREDSLFEIGSITKTITGALLAHAVTQGTLRLEDPVRGLVPAERMRAQIAGRKDITLRDLVTHHSGLPAMDPYYRSGNPINQYEGYDRENLDWYLRLRGLHAPAQPRFAYSNLGMGLLGHILSTEAGKKYEVLVQEAITGPLRMQDTGLTLSDAQKPRVLQGYDAMRARMPICDVGILAPAGAVISTAGDMLTWLEANIDAERARTGPLAAFLAASHKVQANVGRRGQIAMAWFYDPASGVYSHSGSSLGHTADAFFDPARETAVIVLANVSGGTALTAGSVSAHLRSRLTGTPALSLRDVTVPAAGSFIGRVRWFAAYWLTMIAAAAFIFCAAITVQGLVALLLPRRLGQRVSSWLQLTAFALIVGVYCLQSSIVSLHTIATAQHAFYWGIGFALALFLLKTPRSGQIIADAPVTDLSVWQDASTPILVSFFLMGLAVLGARAAFSLPRDLRANWIFRITAVSGRRCVDARRRALAALSVLPVWTISAGLFFTIWPWQSAAFHLLVLALFGALLVELTLQFGVQKIPFTCAYLPGRSNIHVTLWIGLMVLIPLLFKAAAFEAQAMEDTGSQLTMLGVLGAAWAGARWRTASLASAEDASPQFDEEPEDEVPMLNVWDSASFNRWNRSLRSEDSR